MKKDKLKEWMSMEVSEKCKWNGYNGFINGDTLKETSLFAKHNLNKDGGKKWKKQTTG